MFLNIRFTTTLNLNEHLVKMIRHQQWQRLSPVTLYTANGMNPVPLS